MSERSRRASTRNPLILVPEVLAFVAALTPEQKALFRSALWALAGVFRARGNESWKKNKAPMAVYWKGFSVYFRHLSRLMRR